MRHRNKVLREGTWYQLIKSTNPKTGRHHYIISVNIYTAMCNDLNQLRKHFDPQVSRGGKWGTRWKYRSRLEAEKLLTLALLKFGG